MFDNQKNTSWTSDQFIAMSQALGEAYLPGLEIDKAKDKKTLTVNKLIAANKRKSARNLNL